MSIKKYIAVAKFSIKSKLVFLTNYLTTLLSFLIHMLVFNALWDYILDGKAVAGYTKSELIWYIILGEFIIYSVENSYIKIAEMIKQGNIVNLYTKPINFVYYLFAEEASALPKVIVNLVFAIILGLIMGGTLSLNLLQIVLVLITIALSIIGSILLQIIIGLFAFITEENRAIYLMLSKLQLLLVFTPLEFFPKVVQNIFLILPTTYIVYTPAKLLVHFEMNQALFLISGSIISILILIAVISLLYKKGVARINVNGG